MRLVCRLKGLRMERGEPSRHHLDSVCTFMTNMGWLGLGCGYGLGVDVLLKTDYGLGASSTL